MFSPTKTQSDLQFPHKEGEGRHHLNASCPSSGAYSLSGMSVWTPWLLCGPLTSSLPPNSMFLCLTYQGWISALADATSTAPVSPDPMIPVLVVWDSLWWRPVAYLTHDHWLLSIPHSLSGLSQQLSVAAGLCCFNQSLSICLFILYLILFLISSRCTAYCWISLGSTFVVMPGPSSQTTVVWPSLTLAGVSSARSCLSLMFLLRPFHWPCVW